MTLAEEHRAKPGNDLLARVGCVAETGIAIVTVKAMPRLGPMPQLMRPYPVELKRALEWRQLGHINLVDGGHVVGLSARERDDRVDCLEERLYVRDRLELRMGLICAGRGMEPIGQSFDLVRIEHTVGFLEPYDAR